MFVQNNLLPIMAAMYPLVGQAAAGSLADIDHVVLFMQGEHSMPVIFPCCVAKLNAQRTVHSITTLEPLRESEAFRIPTFR
jgi:hypothetical protein